MGIRHLITFLEPYARVESFAGREVVIDAPAFAHHIYYICLKATPEAHNAFEAAPFYSTLVKTALAWLDSLRNSNVVMHVGSSLYQGTSLTGCSKKIYFDGFLPPTKFNTRLERLIDQSRRLTTFHKDKPTPCRASYPRVENELSDLFCGGSVQSNITRLPPLPFLVPAVLEALGQSAEYMNITEVVPGEADLYCAKYLKQHGGIVLTGDSDLLVHDLGPNGAVSFFKDVKALPETSTGELCSHMYQPASIAERLALPESHGVLSLAFEIVMDPFVKFPMLLKQAQASKAITKHPREFSDFISEYVQSIPWLEQAEEESTNVPSILRMLDPRISEFILQFPSLSRKAGSTLPAPPGDAPKPHIFVPFLLHDPSRTSAWVCSTSIRQLAYGLVSLIIPRHEQTPSVFEHRKQYDKSKGRELQLPEVSSIPDECNALLELLSELRSNFSGLTDNQLWIAVAIHQNIQWSNVHAKSSLVTSFMQQFIQLEASEEPGSFSWDTVQFIAELHASYYSFRILKQISNLVMSHSKIRSLPEPLGLLHAKLQSLPKLTGVPSLGDVSSAVRKVGNQGAMREIKSIVDILLPLPGIDPQTPPNTTTKKKRKRVSLPSEPSSGKKRPNNLFELLDIE